VIVLLVLIRPLIRQEPNEFATTTRIEDRDVKRRVPVNIHRIDLCAMIDQELNYIAMVVLRAVV
jgi:hypothetical protein